MPKPPRELAYRTKKSLGTDSVLDAWTRLEAWLAKHLPQTRKALNPPATIREIKSFETAIGHELPASVRESYLRHNGHKPCSAGVIFGLPLLPLGASLANWKGWKDYDRTKIKKYNLDETASCFPVEAVQPVYFTRNWIPISEDAGGNHIAIDFAPGGNGKYGQVIICGRDDTFHPVLAWDWSQFLTDIADELERANYSIDDGDLDYGPRFGIAVPSVRHFHASGANWSRCKLGLKKVSVVDEAVWESYRRKR